MSLKIGEMLALSQITIEHDLHSQLIGNLTEEYLTDIKKIQGQLIQKKNDRELCESFHNVPVQTCSTNDIFLSENIEFFLEYLFGAPDKEICLKVFIHFNNCISCFNIFSQVMRDYFYKNQEIVKYANGVKA